MALDLRLMRYVIAVAEEGGFQRAAERLRIAQPPLSRQIRDLERELGVTLFERRPVTRLTEAGRVFVESARIVLADTDRLVERTVQASRGELGTVRIGYIYSAVFDTVPRIVAAMRADHEGIVLDVREGWTFDLDAGLKNGSYDLVLSRDIPQHPEYQRETLRSERVVAVVDVNHPLSWRGRATLREFSGQRFCHPPRRLAPDRYDYMARALERAGGTYEFAENPVHGLAHLDLHDCRSFALVAASAVGRVPMGTATVTLTDELPPLELQMVWRRDNPSAALNILIQAARRLAEREGWNTSASAHHMC
jgi:DNA-binding transcriptional LysR family regulator